MPAVEVIRPLKVNAPGASELKISNRGPETIYYGQTSSVSSTNNTGTLAQGEALTISGPLPVWLINKAATGGEKQKTAIVDFEEKETGLTSSTGSLGSGEERTMYTPNPGFQLLSIKEGTEAEPDEDYSPLVHVSRTISIPESAFVGDGSPGLNGIYAVVKAVPTSEGQAIGIFGGGQTEGSHVGTHSATDAIGVYAVGQALANAGNERTGIGMFTSGQRYGTEGQTTGIEIVSRDDSGEVGKYRTGGASDSKGIWIHATGTVDSAAGMQFAHVSAEAPRFLVGVAFNKESIVQTAIDDNSSPERGVWLKGKYSEAALAVSQKTGAVVIGNTKLTQTATGDPETPLFEVCGTTEWNPRPLVSFGTAGAFPTLVELARNVSGNLRGFVAAEVGNFQTGSEVGDTGLFMAPTTGTMIFGPADATKRGTLRITGQNMALVAGTTKSSFGTGDGVIFIANAQTAPSTNPTGGGVLYVEGGALKYRGSAGTVTEVGKA